MWLILYCALILLSSPLVVCVDDTQIELRNFAGEAPPRVEVRDGSDAVTFIGLRYNTSMYGDDEVAVNNFTNDGTSVEAFLGIPYAESPTGPRRFARVQLQPVAGLGAEYDATTWKPGCMQEFGMFTDETSNFSENCLFLNVWRRKGTKAGDAKPVVLILHGGGYSAGDGHEVDWRGPQLAHFGDVVVVNANYRLGIFGFLDLGLAQAAGHQGHLDQVEALRWIARYIAAFGGDPTRVTLFGVSAGSFSISWHLMSGQSKGLFHSAVMDAGVLTHSHAETMWDHIERARQIVEDFGCLRKSASFGYFGSLLNSEQWQIFDCLKTIPAGKLIDLQQKFAPSQTYTFRPTFYNRRYLPDLPECTANGELFRSRVPIIIGDTTNEGQFLVTRRTHDPLPEFSSFQDVIDWDLEILAGHHASHTMTRGRDDQLVRAFYDSLNCSSLRNDAATSDSDCLVEKAAQIVGDGLFVCPVMNFANHYARVQQRTYFFRWDRIRETEAFPGEAESGAYHGLMFYTGAGGQYIYLQGQMSAADKAYIRNTIRMIAGFAADPEKEPEFDGLPLARHYGDAVNNFGKEGLELLNSHPNIQRCRAVWPIFSRLGC